MLKLNRAEIINLYGEYYNGSPEHLECTNALENTVLLSEKKHDELAERLKDENKLTHDEYMELCDTAGMAEYESESLGFVMGFEYAFKLLVCDTGIRA